MVGSSFHFPLFFVCTKKDHFHWRNKNSSAFALKMVAIQIVYWCVLTQKVILFCTDSQLISSSSSFLCHFYYIWIALILNQKLCKQVKHTQRLWGNLSNLLNKTIAADITRDREDINCKWIDDKNKEIMRKILKSTNCMVFLSINKSHFDWIHITFLVSAFMCFAVINRNRRSNGGITGSSQQLNAQQQPQQTGPQQQQQQSVNMQVNSIKQVNKVKPNVNRQPPDNAVSPSTYNRYDRQIYIKSVCFRHTKRRNHWFFQRVKNRNSLVWVFLCLCHLFGQYFFCWFEAAANKPSAFSLPSSSISPNQCVYSSIHHIYYLHEKINEITILSNKTRNFRFLIKESIKMVSPL